MLVLALDTASLVGTYGWARIVEIESGSASSSFATFQASARPGHAETLLDRIKGLLSFGGYTMEDLGLIVFGRGPGTFTGVRIGLATVKGMALARDIPIIGISSLEALAFSTGITGTVAALIDARRGELFFCLYRVFHDTDGWPIAEPITDERVGPVDSVIDEIHDQADGNPVTLLGNGVLPYRGTLEERLGQSARILAENRFTPDALWLARIGHKRYLDRGSDHLPGIEPVYLRAPDARLPGRKNT